MDGVIHLKELDNFEEHVDGLRASNYANKDYDDEMKDMEVKLEDLHHSIDIKEEDDPILEYQLDSNEKWTPDYNQKQNNFEEHVDCDDKVTTDEMGDLEVELEDLHHSIEIKEENDPILEYQQDSNETGNPGPPEIVLSSLEEKLIHLTGAIVVDGMNLPELGIDEFPKFKYDEVLLPRNLIIEDGDDFNNVEVSEAKLLTNPKEVDEHQKLLKTDNQVPRSAKARKNFTPHSALKDTKTNKNNEELLIDINNKLESLVDIQRQRLELEKLRFQLDYPAVTIEK